ncbi:PRC-barrel domain-containing protein [Bradyrhizobium erythrophlei]|uniref:PRC-barrel domain-containing protein n=1 Tax=Bradyrhizobium erythrophlei TaxID=1437360 RepID=UPI0035E77920
MLARYIIAGMAGSALLATVAFAQTPTEKSDKAEMKPAETTSSMSHQGNWRASKVVGLNVYNDKNESVGSINDMLMDKSGAIKGVVIGVGGFLGVGEHLVAVSFDKVKFVDEPIVYTGTASTTNTGPTSTNKMSPTTTTGAAPPAPATTVKPNPWYPDHAVFNATKDELKAMPEFKYATQ